MKRYIIIVCFFLSVLQSGAQVRSGWRSIYDTEGRLSRMNYYENGIIIPDSNFLFQYYTDNLVKGIIKGEISRDQRSSNGSVMLFDEAENLLSYNISRNGAVVFSTTCKDGENCLTSWQDQFSTNTKCWIGDSLSIANGEMDLFNKKSLATAIYNPPVTIDLNADFILKIKVPKLNNSSRIGVVLGWKDPKNFLVFEIQTGKYYSLLNYVDGELKQIGEVRTPISTMNDSLNEIRISRSDSRLIFDINHNIEKILPAPDFKGGKVGLITRSRGKGRFQDFVFQYLSKSYNPTLSDYWIGKGTGFFISSNGKIMTTYDAVAGAKQLRVKGFHDGKAFNLPAEVVRLEEEHNLAILQVKDKSFSPFKELPFGYCSSKPVSETPVFSIGFPNSVSGIFVNADSFTGKILPLVGSSSASLLLDMSFRFGMIGAPVFDSNANLIGIVANKGLELRYTEGVDFFSNFHLFQGYLGHFESSKESPLKGLTQQEKIKSLTESVVLIESSVFNILPPGKN